MADLSASQESHPSHRAIRATRFVVWPLVAVFYATGLFWLLLRYSRCQVDDAIEAVCDMGAGLPILLFFVVATVLAFVVFHLHKLSREVEPRTVSTQVPSATRMSARVQGDYRTLPPPHRMHVHNSMRGSVYLLGGLIAFVAFWFRWGDLEAGAWVIQLGFVLVVELFIWWAKPGTSDDVRPTPAHS